MSRHALINTKIHLAMLSSKLKGPFSHVPLNVAATDPTSEMAPEANVDPCISSIRFCYQLASISSL